MYAVTFLIIISAGEFIQMTQSLTGSIIIATARHKLVAWLAVIEAAISVALVVTVAEPYGLIGVCFALAVPQVLFSGLGTMIYGCKITGVSVRRYAAAAILPAAVAAAPAIVVLVAHHCLENACWLADVSLLFRRLHRLVRDCLCGDSEASPSVAAAFTDLRAAIFGAPS